MFKALIGSWKVPMLVCMSVAITLVFDPSAAKAEEAPADYYYVNIAPYIKQDRTLLEFAEIISYSPENYKSFYDLGAKEPFFGDAMYHFFELTQSYSNSKAAMIAAIMRSMDKGCGADGEACSTEIFAFVNGRFRQHYGQLKLFKQAKARITGSSNDDEGVKKRGIERAVNKIARGKCSTDKTQLLDKQETRTDLTYKFECGSSDGGVIGFNQIFVRCKYDSKVENFICK